MYGLNQEQNYQLTSIQDQQSDPTEDLDLTLGQPFSPDLKNFEPSPLRSESRFRYWFNYARYFGTDELTAMRFALRHRYTPVQNF